MGPVHKRFTDDQLKELLSRYVDAEIERTYVQEISGIDKRRFFQLIDDPQVPLRLRPYTYSYVKELWS